MSSQFGQPIVVHSTHPPAIYTDVSGVRRIAAGTVFKIEHGGWTLVGEFSVPRGFTLDNLQWKPVPEYTIPESVELPPDEEWRVASKSTVDGEWIVKRIRGKWSCNCPGYTYRKQCRHIKLQQQAAALNHISNVNWDTLDYAYGVSPMTTRPISP